MSKGLPASYLLFFLLSLYNCGNQIEKVSDNNTVSTSPRKIDTSFPEDLVLNSKLPPTLSYAPPFVRDSKGPFRIAVVVSGEYWEFFDDFKALVEGLSFLGWANPTTLPTSLTTSKEILTYLKSVNYSSYLEFPEDLYIDLEWGENQESLDNLFQNQDPPQVDLILALGGIAGSYFSSLESFPIPVVLESITDPLAAGVIKDYEDSGKDFITCRVDPERFKRQVRLFHDLVGFKTLGILYGDTGFGRIYGAVRDVEEVAKERGFTIIRNTSVLETIDPQTPELYLKALEEVAQKADAVYLGASHGITEYPIMPQVVQILHRYRKPSFALEGPIRVKQGILFGLSMAGVTQSGIYNAKKISLIFSGQSPRSLPQRFSIEPLISLNTASAKAIGFDLPIHIFEGADQVFKDISP